MRKYILMLMMLGAAYSGFAQNNSKQKQPPQKPNDTQMVQQRTNQMVKQYGLNKNQATKLLALNKKYAGKMGPMGGGPQPPRGGQPPKGGKQPPQNGQRPSEPPKDGKQPPRNGQQPPQGGPQPGKPNGQMEKQMKADRAAYEKELATIMTAQQFKKYQADEAKHRQQPPRRNVNKDKKK